VPQEVFGKARHVGELKFLQGAQPVGVAVEYEYPSHVESRRE